MAENLDPVTNDGGFPAPPLESEGPKHAQLTPNKWIPSPEVRGYVYSVAIAGAGVAIGYGIITAAEGGLWLSLAAAVLGFPAALAKRNTPSA